MKVTGIVAEYNPFHKGHEYQLNYAKTISDAVVVVMSGSFVQRGDVAIFDKYTRADVALKHGADLILELPVVFSLNSAERFSYGAVAILDKLNIIDYILFGSESGDIEKLQHAAMLIENEPENVSNRIKELLDKGESFAYARETAFSDIIDSSLLSSPNNILALEYIRQLIKRHSKIKPITQKRAGSGYHEKELNEAFPSATALRHAILNDNFSYSLFSKAVIHRLERLDNLILYNIRKNKQAAFHNISEVSEGIENRIINTNAGSINCLVDLTYSKRYTKARVRRILLSSLLGLNSSLSKKEPEYIRVLGATKTGLSLLKEIKNKSDLDIITKTADYKKDNPMFEKDILASDIYDLSGDILTGAGTDFKTSPVIRR